MNRARLLYIGLFGVLSLLVVKSLAQNVDADSLRDRSVPKRTLQTVDVLIFRQSENFQEGANSLHLYKKQLSDYSSGNIGDVLQNHALVNIKSYGPGNLASTSIRGGSAHQTAVFWNGVNIQSPMLGQTDLSYLPANLWDEVNVVYGSGGVFYGNSTQAGSIHLNKGTSYANGTSVVGEASAGSFGSYSGNLGIDFSDTTKNITITGYHKQAENNFKINNQDQSLSGFPEYQTNADYYATGLMTNFSWQSRVGKKHYREFRMHHWYQESERGTGSPLVGTNTTARLTNGFQRLSASYDYYISNQTVFTGRLAGFNEYLNYADSTLGIYSEARFSTLISEAEFRHAFNNRFTLKGGVLNTLVQAASTNYEIQKRQNRLAPFAILKYRYEKIIRLNLGVRKLFMEGYKVPVTTSLDGVVKLNERLGWKFQVARNYRVPTFNDQFYVPFGRIDLRPESGWTEETGLFFESKKRNTISVTGFRNEYDDMIVWLPDVQTGNWRPDNLPSETYGLETRVEVKGRFHEVAWKCIGSATVQQSVNSSTGYQMLYVPNLLGNASFELEKKQWRMLWVQNYTGARFVSTDESAKLEPFSISNVRAEYRMKKYRGRIGIKLNNLFAIRYQNVLNFPMPGRNFEVFLRYHGSLRKKDKT